MFDTMALTKAASEILNGEFRWTCETMCQFRKGLLWPNSIKNVHSLSILCDLGNAQACVFVSVRN